MNPVVAIDPGHGGNDPGAVAAFGAFTEATYNWQLANYFGAVLEHICGPWEYVLTRDQTSDPSFQDRGRRTIEANADLVLCLHVNSSANPAARLAECYHWPNDKVGRAVADTILRSMPDPLYKQGRVSYAAEDIPGKENDWLRRCRNVLAYHHAPKVLLEVGYCSNEADREALGNNAVQFGIVVALLAGLTKFRQLKGV